MRKLCSMINYDLTEREEGASTTCYITWGKVISQTYLYQRPKAIGTRACGFMSETLRSEMTQYLLQCI